MMNKIKIIKLVLEIDPIIKLSISFLAWTLSYHFINAATTGIRDAAIFLHL